MGLQLPRSTMEHEEQHRLLDAVPAWFSDPAQYLARVKPIYRKAPSVSFDLLTPMDGRVIERQSRPQVQEGRITGRVWSFRDITEQRRAEQALRDETRVLELLNRTGRSLAAKLDLRAVVQAVTDAGTQISGAQFGAFFYAVVDDNGESYQIYTLSGAPREAFDKFGHPRPTVRPTFRGGPPIRSADILQDPRYSKWHPTMACPPDICRCAVI